MTERAEFHAARSKGVGASEIGILAGLSKWGSPYALWLEKTGQLPPDHVEQTEAMVTGTELEPWLAGQFTKRTGLYVAGEQMHVHHREMPWVRATIDGLVVESPASGIDDALGPVEFKYTNDPPWDDEIPLQYEAQVNWQMLATQTDVAWLAALHSFGRFRIYEFKADREAQAALLAVGHDFWHQHVLPRVAPPLGGHGREATAGALRAVYGQGGGGEVDLGHLVEQLETRRILKAEAKALKEQLTDLDNEVLAAMGSADVGLVDGVPLVTLRPSRGFDVEGHAAAEPACHEAHLAFQVGLHGKSASACHKRFKVEAATPERRLDVRWPCERCGRPLRPQDEAKHKCSTQQGGGE